ERTVLTIAGYCLSLMAALTLAAISGGMAVILCAFLACSAPLAITSASSLPSMTALQPGIKSPHRSTFDIAPSLLALSDLYCPIAKQQIGSRRHERPCDSRPDKASVDGARRAVNPQDSRCGPR